MEFNSELAEKVVTTAPALPADVSMDVVLALSAGRGAETRIAWRLDGGSLSVIDDPADDALVITVAAKDAEAILAEALPVPVAYMQGKLKPAGDNGLWLRMAKASRDESFTAWCEAVVSA